MNQSTWEAVVRYYERASKRFDQAKKAAAFDRSVQSVIDKIPVQDREIILNHWQAKKEAVHPLMGTRHPAPLFIVETNLRAPNTMDRASGMMGSEGCAFMFEAMLVYTAPGEVVRGLVAHELAHTWIFAKYHSRKLHLPPIAGTASQPDKRLGEYPTEERHEEELVGEAVRRWGYNEPLIEFWEIAVEDCPSDPSWHYAMLKRLDPNALGSIGTTPV